MGRLGSWSLSAALVGFALVLLGGCGARASGLEGSKWVLTAIEQGGTNLPLPPEAQATLEFRDDGMLGGMGGCNSFGGSYRVDGQQLTVGELWQTLMACEPPLMELEARYTSALRAAQRFAVEGTTLTITTADGTLRFTRA